MIIHRLHFPICRAQSLEIHKLSKFCNNSALKMQSCSHSAAHSAFSRCAWSVSPPAQSRSHCQSNCCVFIWNIPDRAACCLMTSDMPPPPPPHRLRCYSLPSFISSRPIMYYYLRCENISSGPWPGLKASLRTYISENTNSLSFVETVGRNKYQLYQISGLMIQKMINNAGTFRLYFIFFFLFLQKSD